MADTVPETKETVATPEKKVVDKSEAEEKITPTKTAANGVDKPKENGTTDAEHDKAEEESTENGLSKEDEDCVGVKRKSEAGDAPESTPVEGVSPEKKAKLEEKADLKSEAEAVA